jgi:hypothetical protein
LRLKGRLEPHHVQVGGIEPLANERRNEKVLFEGYDANSRLPNSRRRIGSPHNRTLK